MFKFNDTNILTGYIKEMLASFNLPKYRIYTKENRDYYNKNGRELNIIKSSNIDKANSDNYIKIPTQHPRFISYIKDGEIQQYVDIKGESVWKTVGKSYLYNCFVPNETRNFQIKNNIYDYYTHEYLGDYLRFFRDYHDLDLMPLYNCFSNRVCNNIELKFNVNGRDISISGNNSGYKIYMLPIKLFKDYTIAIDCSDGVELFCGVYNKYLNTSNRFVMLPAITYKKTSSTFNKPILYTALIDKLPQILENDDILELAQNEADLKLFIKLPINNDSSITILEGNYIGWNDNVNGKKNKYVVNMENIEKQEQDLVPITKLQLLNMNTKESYPFADRLIEYILGNVITPLDENVDNVKRIQKVMHDTDSSVKIDGIWTDTMRKQLYAYMNSDNVLNSSKKERNHDILGYVDKDVESTFKSANNTLLDVDLYTNENNKVIQEVR